MNKKFWSPEEFFSLFPVHFYMIDVMGRYQSCNESQANDFGLNSISEIIGKTNHEIPSLRNHPSVIKIIEDNNKKVFSRKEPLEFYEPFYQKNGTLIHYKSYKIPIFKQEQLMGLIGISFDVSNETEQIDKLVQKIDQTQLMLSNIIDNLPEHIYWLDRENCFLGCNANQAKDFGLQNSSEVKGLHVSTFQTKENAEQIIANNNKVLNEGVSLSADESYQTPKGDTLYYLSKKVPLKNNEKDIVGLVGISIDITEQKKLEVSLREAKELAEEASKAKTEFLENMRHDIRTPLTGIVGFSEILKMEFEDPRIQEYADNLVASSHALLNLLDEVLEAIRVGSGEIPKLKKKFNLQNTLQTIIDLNRAKASQKKLQLSLDVDSKIPQYLVGDKIRIHRVALELMANALNFTDSGFVKLSAKFARDTERGVIIKLIVEDSGMGIPKDKQQDIYVQFTRLTPSYQGIYKGAGLGLSVIKQFIDDLDGEIYVKSEPGKGSKFTCVLPLQKALLDDNSDIDEEMDIALDKPYETTYALETQLEREAKPSKNQHQILVVEDNVIAQKATKSILSHFDCNIDIAENGKKAMELWKNGSYDLILMDIGLPDMSGYEITHLIRVQELVKKTHIPIIALTAHGGEENKKRCIDAGMNAVLVKPLTAKNCSDIIDSFIPGRRKEKNETSVPRYSDDLPENEEDLLNLAYFLPFDLEEGIKTMGSEELLSQMLDSLINESLPEDLAKLKEEHQNGNWEATQKMAHKIKGGAVYVGAMKLKMACQYLERYWKSGQRVLLEKLYLQVLSVSQETEIVIGEFLSKRR